MSGYWKAQCGLCFTTRACGNSYYMGKEWGDDYDVEICRCPYEECSCNAKKEFEPYKAVGDCEAVRISKEEYNYDTSREKIYDIRDKQSYDKIIAKFGAMCMATQHDGKGGYKVKRDDMSCSDCWNDICVVTGQKRDLTKVRIFADLEIKWVDELGFIKEEHKNLIRKQVTDIVPLEFAERCLKMKDCGIMFMFETNNTSGFEYDMGWKPRPKILRYYIVKSNAKRDLLEDLQAIQQGYKVIHDSDNVKAKKAAKKKRIQHKKDLKTRRIKERIAARKIEQTTIFKENRDEREIDQTVR